MQSDLKSFKLYSHPLGPNPWKVAIILSCLKLPYTTVWVDFKDVKSPPFVDMNPNGRLPVLFDPNREITLWESGAIVTYLVELYDVARVLSYEGFHERILCQQWLHFQTSGQGPYYGQLGWFSRQVPQQQAAIERYAKEVYRVTGVLDKELSERQWLVGGKCTYADLVFLPWQDMVSWMMGDGWDEGEFARQFPFVTAWVARMKQLPEVAQVLFEKQQAMATMPLKP
ncbi:hypothetical protein N7532_002730 [Penicillium argentinense]|uniref:Glutathione S-transferase n=1 Tax=Penicillium argentinense TaxID=1131581 RepID=A0A9W9KKW9_9EURO|nr:uncharacterized protein N7532_002730 [Penicillium argentinense]KAJ5110085.1 hypothetical protein N7532_002730 [Penicillium argentinense]